MLLQYDFDWNAYYWSAYWSSMLIWLIPLLIYYVLGVLCAIWVYRDAKGRRGMPATTWLVIVLLTGIVGLIIYIIIREN